MNDLNRLKLEHGVHVYFSAPQKTGSVVARAHFQNKKVRLRELKSSTYSSEAVAVEAVREYIEHGIKTNTTWGCTPRQLPWRPPAKTVPMPP